MRSPKVPKVTALLLGVGTLVGLSLAARVPATSQGTVAVQGTTCESCEEVVLAGGKESWACVPGGYKDCNASMVSCSESNPCPGVGTLEERLVEYRR